MKDRIKLGVDMAREVYYDLGTQVMLQQMEQKKGGKGKKFICSFMTMLLLSSMMCTPVFAAETTTSNFFSTVFDSIHEVYTNIVLISTIIAVTCAAVALICVMFGVGSSKNAISWLKRIALAYLGMHALGLGSGWIAGLLEGGTAVSKPDFI